MRIIKCVRGQYEVLSMDPNFVYCGRRCGDFPASPLGNPFVVGRDGTRAEVIAKYRRWLWQQIQVGLEYDQRRGESAPGEVMWAFTVLEELRSLTEDSVLGCWCVEDDMPEECLKGCEACHCHVVVAAAHYLRALNNGGTTK